MQAYYAAWLVFLSWFASSPDGGARFSTRARRLQEVASVARDIASTDATIQEAKLLASIAVHESGVRPIAHGRAGERGAFQVMPPAPSYGAREALRRLRAQGLEGYAGCPRGCPKLAAALAKYAD
jgi:hypothetical protein